MTRISIFGLGYVGTVSAACLADSGHSVIGVDVNPTKVELINSGRSPIVEEGMAELVKKGVDSGQLLATSDPVWAVMNSDISLICVGTPSRPNGSLNLDYVRRVSQDIGIALATKPRMLLLDEPLAGLAAAERERVSRLVKTMAEYIPILIVEHDIVHSTQ